MYRLQNLPYHYGNSTHPNHPHPRRLPHRRSPYGYHPGPHGVLPHPLRPVLLGPRPRHGLPRGYCPRQPSAPGKNAGFQLCRVLQGHRCRPVFPFVRRFTTAFSSPRRLHLARSAPRLLPFPRAFAAPRRLSLWPSQLLRRQRVDFRPLCSPCPSAAAHRFRFRRKCRRVFPATINPPRRASALRGFLISWRCTPSTSLPCPVPHLCHP